MARRGRKRRPGASRSAPPAAPRRRMGPPGARAEEGRHADRAVPGGAAGTNGRANGRGDAAGSGTGRDDAMTRGYARSRERDEAVRASLVPLAPGERPKAVVAAAALAALIAAGNLTLIAVGWEVDGERPILGGLIFTAVMVVAAIGMWQLRYWAVLGFQVLLGVSLVFALLGLLRASNVAGVIACFVVLGIAGPLFWKLIRAMARIQMPERARREVEAARAAAETRD